MPLDAMSRHSDSRSAKLKVTRFLETNDLIKLHDLMSCSPLHHIKMTAKAVGNHQPFYLAYQGLNDRKPQQLYGDLVCRIMSLRYPQFADKLAMPTYAAREKIRIGFVSAFFHNHSNWKIPIKGWVENLNKQNIEQGI